MSYLLFIAYSILFCWLITRMRFFRETGLTAAMLVGLFLVRIAALLVGCYLNVFVMSFSDSLVFHQMGLQEFHLLAHEPHAYFAAFFHNPYPHGYARVFEDVHSFWNNLRTILIAKMLSVFDFLSWGNFWTNTLIFNFLVFFGCAALYRTFIRIFPRCVFQLVFCIFLLPSALLFSSMIHRDGLIFLAISLIIFQLFMIRKTGRASFRRVLTLGFLLIMVFLLRNFVFLALLPALASWFLACRYPQRAFLCFTCSYIIGTVAFFLSGAVSPRMDFPRYVSERQSSFVEIGNAAHTAVSVVPLAPDFKSFLVNAPTAFNLVLMRPYITEAGKPFFAPFSLEILLIEILFILAVFFHKPLTYIDPMNYFVVFMSLTMLMMAGYTVPIIGALVRYRSIYFIFLTIPIVCYIEWSKLKQMIIPVI